MSKALSQEALSLQSGLYRTYVGLIERGRHVPTVATLDKLARTLAVDARAFLDPDLTFPDPPTNAKPLSSRKSRRSPS